MTHIPDPYGRGTIGGKTLDNATIERLHQAEEKLGYELTITQGIGGAVASGGSHLEGRAVDLAPWDWKNKLRVLKDLGFIGWYRPELWRNGVRIWPAHIHAVLIFDGRDNRRGVADLAFRQIAMYDAGGNGLVGNATDTLHPYRASPLRGFSREDYKKSFAAHKPKPRFKKIELVSFNLWVGNKNPRGNVRQLIEDTGRPVGLSLQEAKGDKLKLSGYTSIHAPARDFPHPEARSNRLLIRNRGVEILNHGFLDMSKHGSDGWRWGPKSMPKVVKHPPKIYPWARIDTEDQEWMLLAGHRVVSGFKINKSEWEAEDKAIEQWFGKRPRIPSLAGMDWNDRVGGNEPLGVESLAQRCDAVLEILGIDGGMVAGADRSGSHKLDEKYGSDGHRPVVITAKKEI